MIGLTSPKDRFSFVDYLSESNQVDSVGCGIGPIISSYSCAELEWFLLELVVVLNRFLTPLHRPEKIRLLISFLVYI